MMSTRTLRRTGALALLLLLAGCAPPSNILPYEKDVLREEEPDPGNISRQYNRVAMFQVEEPDVYGVRILDYDTPNPGVTLPGRIVGEAAGQVAEQADRANRNLQLTESLREWNFSIADELNSELRLELEDAGMEVLVLESEDHRHAGPARGYQYLGEYPEVSQPIDAYLHVYLEFAGYSAVKPDSPYVPTVEVLVQAVDPQTKRALYSATYTYGGAIPVEGPTDRPADPKYNVRDFGWLCAGREQCEMSPAVQGLRAAAMQIADMVAAQLTG
ncbi:MAG TPA: hypothetical protein QF361_03185 [Gammaproteobacteria bacterium]|nr:hypothetical protein [Gammaproteobacteria bacterium]